MDIQNVDICCGLAWGDESKGKIVSHLSKINNYDFICRWAGGNNAGHTIIKNGIKYKTHLIPSGIFYGIKCIIGPDCVINIDSFKMEIEYLKRNGFDTNLIKISPKAHIVTLNHISDDTKNYNKELGTTNKGIAPCYRDKYGRTGQRVCDEKSGYLKQYIWDEKLYGNILCEGAQGYWLDINKGDYPYITSSTTLPYGACSLGFSPKLINKIYGACKIYDTRSGIDPNFPESLLEDPELSKIIVIGEEYGTTTGRKRKVNWLNMDKLIEAINITGTTHIIISKVDVLVKVKIFKYIYMEKIHTCKDIEEIMNNITVILSYKCPRLTNIYFSNNKETIKMV